MTLRSAIRSMTALPAEKLNIKDRGKLDQGKYADIAVIDTRTLTDKATYQDPHQYAEGIQYLLVNGKLSIDKGKATGKRGGRAIRKG